MLTIEDIIEAKKLLESYVPEISDRWYVSEVELYNLNVHLGALGQPTLYFGDTFATPYGPKIITRIPKL